jgi:probable biosynthetic protein (TIGR04098 family)
LNYEYDLAVGLPHTNYGGLADYLLLAHAGHFQWTSIARAIGKPLSELRTIAGGEVYATFYFIEEQFPAGTSIGCFKLDDRLRFQVFLRAFKNIAVEGRIVFDHASRMTELRAGDEAPNLDTPGRHPHIRFGNIFITPEAGNSVLRVAPPANADFSALPPLPNEENPYQITKEAEHTGDLGLLGDGDWTPVDRQPAFDTRYVIDADRDTNGAGLVYFANYIAFMDAAERVAMKRNALRPFTAQQISDRALQRRRVAYYGNVDVTDAICTEVALFSRHGDDRVLGVRYAIRRQHDGRLICRSEAIKVIPPPDR